MGSQDESGRRGDCGEDGVEMGGGGDASEERVDPLLTSLGLGSFLMTN